MRKILIALVAVALSPLLFAQQTLNNEGVIKLVKAGLSDDLVISTINASPGTYDTSVDGLVSLKNGGASEKVIAAIVAKSKGAAAAGTQSPDPTGPSPATPTQTMPGSVEPSLPRVHPRVFLQSQSKGGNRNSLRDQSMEMSKDFEKDCPDVKITISAQSADYTVLLNHIEYGLLVRDNQFQVANRDGDLISRTKEGGSIEGGIKKACKVIMDDWAKQAPHP